ncbi:MAG: 23S rRNA (adenine(2503)-C(2))-methyltransferase RlmN [Clostridia bacterium]|nr:23S rRNA (adenine(2503)-C(2))-methyltransferase RlmN [Clostridia bacterium]
MINIRDLNLEEIESELLNMGEKKYRAKQIFAWIYRNVESFDEMTDLSKDLIAKLKERFYIKNLEVANFQKSKDGTIKYLFKLNDGHAIESVIMKYKYGNTACVSNQVGCKMGCNFCASAKIGFIRNLTPGEIVSQILEIEKHSGEKISNVVFMGIGEPLDNYDNVMKAIRFINDPKGLNIGARHISISTCGLVHNIKRLTDENLQCNLCISLHSSRDEVRTSMMPINKVYTISQVIDACKYYIEKTNRRITFEYALVDGVNDSLDDALHLSKLLKGMLCHVNLIPINKIKDGIYEKSSVEKILAFRDYLNDKGIVATVRRELGSDISAACGQLVRQSKEDDNT